MREQERTAIFCSSIATRNSLQLGPLSLKRKPFISHLAFQGLYKGDGLVPRADGQS